MTLTFRRRIQLALVALGTVPTAIAVIGLVLAVRPTSEIGDGAVSTLESVRETGRDLVRTVDSTHLSAVERRALNDHARALNEALSRTRRAETYARYYAAGIAAVFWLTGHGHAGASETHALALAGSLVATFGALALLVVGRRNEQVPAEWGIGVLFAVASAATILFVAINPTGDIERQPSGSSPASGTQRNSTANSSWNSNAAQKTGMA